MNNVKTGPGGDGVVDRTTRSSSMDDWGIEELDQSNRKKGRGEVARLTLDGERRGDLREASLACDAIRPLELVPGRV